MRKIFCDGCGIELPETTQKSMVPYGSFDLCPKCSYTLSGINVRDLVLSTIQAKAEERKKASDKTAFIGRGSQEKKAVFEALQAFYKEKGIGCLAELSVTSGMDIEVLRRMKDGEKVDMRYWLCLGKAMGVLPEAS